MRAIGTMPTGAAARPQRRVRQVARPVGAEFAGVAPARARRAMMDATMNERAAGAQAAGDEALDDLEIRVLEQPADLRRLVVLLNQVWGTVTPLVGVELLRAIDHTGGYVAGAFSQQRMVGGSLGFLGRHRDEIALHSHITGILPGVRHTGLGRQMKLHQREHRTLNEETRQKTRVSWKNGLLSVKQRVSLE